MPGVRGVGIEEEKKMFLTPEELQGLTAYKTKAKQIAWLRANGYPFEIAGDGRPRVLTAAVLAKLGGLAQQSQGPKLRFPKKHEAA